VAEQPIILTGMKETLEALKEFDKDAVRSFSRVINSELLRAESLAKGFIPKDPPMRGWRTVPAKNPRKTTRGGAGWPAWDSQKARDGIKKTRRTGKVRDDYTVSAGALIQEDASGAIFEVAGRRSGSTNQFTHNLNGGVLASRAIWRAVDKIGPEIRVRIAAALEDAKRELQANLNKRKG